LIFALTAGGLFRRLFAVARVAGPARRARVRVGAGVAAAAGADAAGVAAAGAGAAAAARRADDGAARFFARFAVRLAGRALAWVTAGRLRRTFDVGGASAPAATGSPARPMSGVATRLVADAIAAASTRPSNPAEIQMTRSRMLGQRVRRVAKNR
jgi:hypothetical protein